MWYKLVEKHPEGMKTLFHGVNRSRLLPQEVWIKAEEKLVKDGSSKTSYLSGWHILPSRKAAKEYLKKFKKRLGLLHIVPCQARHVRPKEHSNSPVYLARWIKLIKE